MTKRNEMRLLKLNLLSLSTRKLEILRTVCSTGLTRAALLQRGEEPISVPSLGSRLRSLECNWELEKRQPAASKDAYYFLQLKVTIFLFHTQKCKQCISVNISGSLPICVQL